MTLLHHHGIHRARQLRWVLPLAGLLLAAAVGTLVVQYRMSDQEVGAEFFRAHKTISHTGTLLRHGLVAGLVVLALGVAGIVVVALRVTHRIVRPVHAIHRALEALATGDLGVRVEVDRADEFREVADALNALVARFATTLGRVHELVDRLATTSADDDRRRLVAELDRTVEFFRLAPGRVIREDGA
jgi:methyl-accepting chemotaxis protein